jgi:hypothetical protein
MSISADNTEPYIVSGDDKTWLITIVDNNGAVVDLTNAKAYFTVKKNKETTTVEIQKRNTLAGGSDSEIEMSDPTNGKMKIHLVPTDTSTLQSRSYKYDIQVIINSKTYTIKLDTENFLIIGDVTN